MAVTARTQWDIEVEDVKRRERPSLVLVDEDLNVIFADEGALTRLIGPPPDESPLRLSGEMAMAVRSVAESDVVGVHGNLLRVTKWNGPSGRYTCISIEQRRKGHDLPWAIETYGLTPRQAEVLSLLCRGLSSREICAHMSICKATLADHVKALLAKTNSRSRSDMLAKILR